MPETYSIRPTVRFHRILTCDRHRQKHMRLGHVVQERSDEMLLIVIQQNSVTVINWAGPDRVTFSQIGIA